MQGSDPNLEPYLLLAHIDVVPASESDGWDVPPFSAEEIDGFIYGRGTIDDKSPVMVTEKKILFELSINQRIENYSLALHVPNRLSSSASCLSGNPSGPGVLTDKRLCSTQRILHQSWS